MIVRVVKVSIKPEYLEQFEKVTGANHRGSIQESGVVRFDVLRDDKNPGEYVLYEMYRDTAAVQAHKETVHYREWRDAVEPMMTRPRQGNDLRMIFPETEAD